MLLAMMSSAQGGVGVRYLAVAGLMLFPAMTNLVEHAGSTFLLLFTLLGLPLLLTDRRRHPVPCVDRAVFVAFAAYFLALFFSFSLNLALGLLEDPRLKHIEKEFRFLGFIPLYILFRHVKLEERALWSGILGGAAISGAYALLSYYWLHPGVRVSGAYHAIAFGDLSMALAFMSIPAAEYFKRSGGWRRYLPYLAFVLGLVAAILSGTRGAWVAIPALTLYIFFFSGLFPKRRVGAILLAAILVLSAVSITNQMVEISERVRLVIAEIEQYRDGERSLTSTSARIEGWSAAYDIFKENPVIGAGPGSYTPQLKGLIERGREYNNAVWHSQPHNMYLTAMAEGGILGLLALIGVFLLPLRAALCNARKPGESRRVGVALAALVIGFMHFALTESIFGRNINLTFYIILTAALMAVAANAGEVRRPQQPGEGSA
jgi:O-antigen ligase